MSFIAKFSRVCVAEDYSVLKEEVGYDVNTLEAVEEHNCKPESLLKNIHKNIIRYSLEDNSDILIGMMEMRGWKYEGMYQMANK